MSKRAKGEHIAQVAQSMIVRGQMFAAAIKAQRGDFVRLSIHESTKSQKVSVGLNPQDQNAIGHTPWHSCVVVGVDGSYRAAHVDQVRDTHDLVIKNGQLYCYRERSELFDWSKEGLNVDFEHLYPCGLIIRPINDSGESPSIRTIAMSKLRQLSCNMSPVVCRGFEIKEGEGLFIEKAAELGKVATWSQDIISRSKTPSALTRKTTTSNRMKQCQCITMACSSSMMRPIPSPVRLPGFKMSPNINSSSVERPPQKMMTVRRYSQVRVSSFAIFHHHGPGSALRR